MAIQRPTGPTYHLPTSQALGAAVDKALNDARRATEHLGRTMAVVTAAGVRDILTGHESDAPFGAARLELVEGEDGSLFPTGRYWTQAGEERTFTEAVGQTDAGNALHDLSGWTAYLDESNWDIWWPLCDELPDRDRRRAFALDLARAAALTIEPAPAEAAGEVQMVEALVCANDRDRYPALLDPADQRGGHVRPWFDLPTVRRIAADTRREARRYGHGSTDTVHVLTGTVDGARHTVVVVVSWMRLGGEHRTQAVEVLHPNTDGRYAVGGHAWCWYALDDDLMPQIPFRPASA
ncbi:hypothetical protein AQJ30_15590 [Streptomyces longwoodensis]|uniref:Uncharacterized protein n=1 Tax=Streptomyces longwoodensis TaxID=68231 RepID=A0A101QX04_9ACTN|nr:hypothetical protein [Streptomyces longwoodensis]KUN37705.1 hypothetical protein AQJ30_15590 [Streptomyces longwoodensis]